MDLFTFLVISIILCSVILLVQGGGGEKVIQILAVLSIAAEVLFILLAKDAIDLSMESSLRKILPFSTGVVGLIGLFRLQERSVPLLIFFASLLQFFVEMDIIKSLD